MNKPINGVLNFKRKTKNEKLASFNRVKELISKHVNKKESANLIEIIETNYERFLASPGSYDKHQPWEGGYFDHLQQVFEYAIKSYDSNLIKHLPKHEKYSLSDVLLVLFFHDIEKPYKYVEPISLIQTEYSYFLNGNYIPSGKENFAKEYGVELSDKHKIALHYVHGENEKNYHKSLRRQSPLGAAAGNADRFSARVLFNVGYNLKGEMIKYKGPNLEGENIGTLKDII